MRCLNYATWSICFIQSLLHSFRRDELDEELNDELKKSAFCLTAENTLDFISVMSGGFYASILSRKKQTWVLQGLLC